MSETTNLGDELQQHRRVPAPSSHITCADNAAELELTSHRRAQAATQSTAGTKHKVPNTTMTPSSDTEATMQTQATKRSAGLKAPSDTIAAPLPSSSQTLLPLKPNQTGPDGLLKDIALVDPDEPRPVKKSHVDRSQDIDHFFSAPFLKDGKKYRNCNSCSHMQKRLISFINEAMTL
ncbi:hypothetical protein JVT61DRAFT_3318 [Boletus reticuloceps]|uniref:Uncharacterized protein n=1 Tax=Boletus reticuloceps TaxID=495285 RepID=A0A8I3A7Z5_9AGAM|nr:hypothetical protein JVT61DRAFT_3318 [Boletus reticuloceps]